MPQHLDKRTIDAFEYAGGWDVRWDGDVTGLGVRIYPSGKKSFVLSYRTRGGSRRKRLMTLGPVGTLTLAEARRLARIRLAEVLNDRDPAEERLASRRASTFGEVFEAYLENHARPHKKTWREDERRFRLHVPKAWLKRPVTDIRRADIRALHVRLGQKTPYEANRVLALLRVVFNYARKADLVGEDHRNPAHDIAPFAEHSRKRFASRDEIAAIFRAVDAEPNIHLRALFCLYLLTGARRSELLERKWEDVDTERRRLRLADTKSGEEQFIPLSSPAVAIIETLPRVEGNPYLFPGARAGQHWVNVSKAWKRVRERAGVGDLRLHDLRRTVGSWMSQGGVDLNAIKSALRHRDIATTLVYARLHDEVAASALEAHGEAIMKIGGGLRTAAPDG